jgi:hypothetical protein
MGYTEAFSVNYQSDGSADVATWNYYQGEGYSRTATWTQTKNGEIELTYATPFKYEYLSDEHDSTGYEFFLEASVNKIRIRQIASGAMPLFQVQTLGSQKVLTGINTGQVSPWTGFASTLTAIKKEDTKSFITADFASGRKLFGTFPTFDTVGDGLADLLFIQDSNNVFFVRSERQNSWRLLDGSFELSSGDVRVVRRRLKTYPNSIETWIAERFVGDQLQSARVETVAFITEGLKFNEVDLKRHWQSGLFPSNATAGQFFIDLLADGTGNQVSQNPGEAPTSTKINKWFLESSGSMTAWRFSSSCDPIAPVFTGSCRLNHVRTWDRIGTYGNQQIVLETIAFPSFGFVYAWRVNAYTDSGPSTASAMFKASGSEKAFLIPPQRLRKGRPALTLEP